MANEVAWQNKDITSKVMAEQLKEKSLSVYGLKVPKIVQVLPTNLPEISANELRIDNLFLLEDGTLAIIDYESEYAEGDKVKYMQYIVRVLERYRKEGKLKVKIRMIVIYTADVNVEQVKNVYDVGALSVEIQPAFLSNLDPNEIMERLRQRIDSGERLTDEEMMEFIILPLTYRGKETKKKAVMDAINLAKRIEEAEVQKFIMSGIVVFADKVIDKETGDEIGRWIMMTKVGMFFQEKENRAVADALAEAEVQAKKEMEKATEKAILLFVRDKQEDGVPREKVLQKLTRYYHLSEDKAEEYYEKAQKSVVS